MNFFHRLGEALKLVKKQKSAEKTARMLTDNPLTVELIARIAREYDWHFEIVQRDGTILRFEKKVNGEERDGTGGFW